MPALAERLQSRTDGGAPIAQGYTGGTPAAFRVNFFIRDSSQESCGASFTTNRLVFSFFQSATSRTLFSQDVAVGWSFAR